MVLSLAGMVAAAAGMLLPVTGAIAQEAIDLAAVLNALRTARPPRVLTDFETPRQPAARLFRRHARESGPTLAHTRG
jgi:hypothetical protein